MDSSNQTRESPLCTPNPHPACPHSPCMHAPTFLQLDALLGLGSLVVTAGREENKGVRGRSEHPFVGLHLGGHPKGVCVHPGVCVHMSVRADPPPRRPPF